MNRAGDLQVHDGYSFNCCTVLRGSATGSAVQKNQTAKPTQNAAQPKTTAKRSIQPVRSIRRALFKPGVQSSEEMQSRMMPEKPLVWDTQRYVNWHPDSQGDWLMFNKFNSACGVYAHPGRRAV